MHILRLERPEYIFHKVGPTLQQLKFKYEFAWALLHERPFLRKLIQTLHVKLIGYVFGQLGVEKCIRNGIFLLPSVWGSRMSLLQCSTRGQMTVKTGMTGLPLVPGGSDWCRSRCRQYGKEQTAFQGPLLLRHPGDGGLLC